MADSTTLGHSLRQLLLFSLVALHFCFSFFHSPRDLNIVFFLRSIEMPRRVAWKLLSCFYSLFLSLSIRSLFPTRRLVLLFLFYISSARYFARRRSSWLTHFALDKKKTPSTPLPPLSMGWLLLLALTEQCARFTFIYRVLLFFPPPPSPLSISSSSRCN